MNESNEDSYIEVLENLLLKYTTALIKIKTEYKLIRRT